MFQSNSTSLSPFLCRKYLKIRNIDPRWSGNVIWPGGSIVRYGKELYKAESEMNSAEPSNPSQSRFYVSTVVRGQFLKWVLFESTGKISALLMLAPRLKVSA
jgi:hypothetical protein